MSKKEKDIDLESINFEIDKEELMTRASGTIEKRFAGPGPSGWYIGMRWSSSRSGSENASNVTATLFIRTQGSGYTISSTASKSLTLTIDGNSGSGSNTVGLGTNASKDLLTRTVKVWHNGDGSKTCSFSCSAVLGLTLSGVKYNTVSHSGSGTLDKFNLNSAPWWTSDDARMNDIRGHVTVPENWGGVTITSATANDSEQGGNIHYDIHRHVNGGYSGQIKWGGSGLTVSDNIGGWGQGTRFRYECKVHDGHGLWASGSRWSWEYTKNTFTRASVDTIGSIGDGTSTLSFAARTARNSGGGNGHVNTEFGYRIESLTSGVGIHGTNTTYSSSHSDITFILGVKNNGGNPTNPHWLDANELKNALRGSNYAGNIRLRLVSWNSYGSSGSFDFNVWVDLRKNPGWTTIRYGANNKIRLNNVDYYIPAYLPFYAEWDHVPDPLNGGNCSYDVLYQVGDGSWVHLGSTSSNSYTAHLGSTAIGNSRQTDFRIIIRAKTGYGNYSESGGTKVNLWNYAPPSVKVDTVTRNKDNVVLAGSISLNTSIPNITTFESHWRWDSGGPNTNNTMFTPSGSGATRPFTLTISASQNVAGEIHIASSDQARALIEKIAGVPWGNTNVNIKAYMPVMSLTRNGLGINTRPYSGFKLSVDGNAKIEGNLTAWNMPGTIPSHSQVGQIQSHIQAWRTGYQTYCDEAFKFSTNNITKYDNSGSATEVSRVASNDTPTDSGYLMQIRCTKAANPGWGGFTFQKNTKRNQTLTFIFTAKFPADRYLSHAHNSVGDGAVQGWLTSNKGTGKWQEYAYQMTAGTGGSFSSAGFFYLQGGGTPTSSNPLTWWVAKATCFETSPGVHNISVRPDGVTEIGRIIDFHSGLNEVNEDYTVRLEGNVKGSHGDRYPLLISNQDGWLKLGTQNSSYAHYETGAAYGHYFNGKLTCTNTFQVNKGCEGNWNYSQIFFPAQSNDSGRIIHYEANNTAQLWLIPSDDPAADGPDRVVVGTLSGNDHSLGGSWHAGISLYTDGRADFAKHINTVGGRCVTHNHANGYWGLSEGGYGGQSWMRTTTSGFIPYEANQEGRSGLGTGGWPFREVVTRILKGPDQRNLDILSDNNAIYMYGHSNVVVNTPDNGRLVPSRNPSSATTGTNLGASTNRWTDVWCRTSSMNGSDFGDKENIHFLHVCDDVCEEHKVNRKTVKVRDTYETMKHTPLTSSDFYNALKNCTTATYNHIGHDMKMLGIIANDVPIIDPKVAEYLVEYIEPREQERHKLDEDGKMVYDDEGKAVMETTIEGDYYMVKNSAEVAWVLTALQEEIKIRDRQYDELKTKLNELLINHNK